MAKGRRRNSSAAVSATRAPRRGRRPDRSARLNDIVSRYVGELVAAISQEFRRGIADEVRDFIASNGPSTALVAGRTRRAGAGRKKIVGCIAPGCSNASKGPRFHYLCEKHKDAPKKDYEAWRLKARQDKQAA
jgi:hypothetical protein